MSTKVSNLYRLLLAVTLSAVFQPTLAAQDKANTSKPSSQPENRFQTVPGKFSIDFAEKPRHDIEQVDSATGKFAQNQRFYVVFSIGSEAYLRSDLSNAILNSVEIFKSTPE